MQGRPSPCRSVYPPLPLRDQSDTGHGTVLQTSAAQWYSELANGIREGWAFLTVKNPLLIMLVYGFWGFSVDRRQGGPCIYRVFSGLL